MRTVIVLGGADGSLPTLRAAKRLGFRTVCVDMRSDAPGVREADEYLLISTRDVAGIASALSGRSDVAGVMSPASDVNLPHMAELAHRLGLPCALSAEALRISTDKDYFRKVCGRLGLPQPAHVAGTAAEVLEAARNLPLPLIVKPLDQNGGRGISACAHRDEIAGAVATAEAASGSGRVIAEQFLSGTDRGLEAVLVDGKVTLIGLTLRVLTPAPLFITAGHDMFPAPSSEADTAAAMFERICAAVGFRDGSFNADILVTEEGQVIPIEMGMRVGGTGLPELLALVYGADVLGADVLAATGQPTRLAPRTARYASSRVLRSRSEGKLVAINGLDEARALPGVADLVISIREGEHVEPYTHARAKLGYVLAAASEPDELRDVLQAVDRIVQAEVETSPR